MKKKPQRFCVKSEDCTWLIQKQVSAGIIVGSVRTILVSARGAFLLRTWIAILSDVACRRVLSIADFVKTFLVRD